MDLAITNKRKLCIRGLKDFSARSHLPVSLKLLIAIEDDWIDAEDFVVKASLWLRLLEIEESQR